MERKYNLSNSIEKLIENKTYLLYQLIAAKDFGNIKKGDLGGYVENEESLSQEGSCWVAQNACVFNSSKVVDNAYVCGASLIGDGSIVSGYSTISGDSKVLNFSLIENTKIVNSTIISSIIKKSKIIESGIINSQINAVVAPNKSFIFNGRIKSSEDYLYYLVNGSPRTIYKDYSNNWILVENYNRTEIKEVEELKKILERFGKNLEENQNYGTSYMQL